MGELVAVAVGTCCAEVDVERRTKTEAMRPDRTIEGMLSGGQEDAGDAFGVLMTSTEGAKAKVQSVTKEAQAVTKQSLILLSTCLLKRLASSALAVKIR